MASDDRGERVGFLGLGIMGSRMAANLASAGYEPVAAKIVELGGKRVDSSRTTIDFGGTPLEFVYCTDPDGVRIELMDL